MKHSPKNCKNKGFSSYTRIHYKLTLIPIHYEALNLLMWRFGPNDAASCVIIDILFFHCSFVDMLNIISTCRDILCVDINVDKRCVDHSTNTYVMKVRENIFHLSSPFLDRFPSFNCKGPPRAVLAQTGRVFKESCLWCIHSNAAVIAFLTDFRGTESSLSQQIVSGLLVWS